MGVPHTRCAYCHSPLCVKCGDRLTTLDGCHRCPVCRQWKLNGGHFGVPFSDDEVMTLTSKEDGGGEHSGDAVDAFCDRVLSRLDGHITIVPRVDDSFLLGSEQMCVVSKLARTDHYCCFDDDEKYTEEGESISQVRRKLKRVCRDAASARPCPSFVHLWVRRKTYATENMPVEEAAVFRVRGNNLLQLHPDAWIDVLGDLLQEQRMETATEAVDMMLGMTDMMAGGGEAEEESWSRDRNSYRDALVRDTGHGGERVRDAQGCLPRSLQLPVPARHPRRRGACVSRAVPPHPRKQTTTPTGRRMLLLVGRLREWA